MDNVPVPESYCTPEAFTKMKEEILKGKSDTISPNMEGTLYLEELLKTPLYIIKELQGYRISVTDIDEPSSERLLYYYTLTPGGASMIVKINYLIRGAIKMIPAISVGIYCKDSRDTVVNNIVKNLLETTKKHHGK